MTVTFAPAKRQSIPLLIGIAGGTGSGKSLSALLLARGIAGGAPFAMIDTENGRGLHYADQFPEMQHGRLDAPFRPERYADAITDAAKQFPVVVVDSFSHEWAGDGGCLDWKDELTNGDDKRSPAAWAKVKPAHKRMMTRLLQAPSHVILCLRAEEKMDIVRENGQIKFVPKTTLPGGSLDGWVPITEKNAVYEMTASFLLTADAPGVPRPMKLQEQHRGMVPLDRPLSVETGAQLAAWAAGGSVSSSLSPVRGEDTDPDTVANERDELWDWLLGQAADMEKVRAALAANAEKHAQDPARHVAWLREQKQKVEARQGTLA